MKHIFTPGKMLKRQMEKQSERPELEMHLECLIDSPETNEARWK